MSINEHPVAPNGTITLTVPLTPGTGEVMQQQAILQQLQPQQQLQQQTQVVFQQQQVQSIDGGFVSGHSINEVFTNNNFVACSTGVGIQFGSAAVSSPGSVGQLSNPSSGEVAFINNQQISPENTTTPLQPIVQPAKSGVVITKIVEHPPSYTTTSSAFHTDTEDEWSRRASAVDPREIQMVAEKMMRTMPNLFTEVTKKLAPVLNNQNPDNNSSSCSGGAGHTLDSSYIAPADVTPIRNHHIDLDGSLPNLTDLELVAAATSALVGGSIPVTTNLNLSSFPNNTATSSSNVPTNSAPNPSFNQSVPNISSAGDKSVGEFNELTNQHQNSQHQLVQSPPSDIQHQLPNNCSDKPFSASSPSIVPCCPSSTETPATACCNHNKAIKLQVGGGFLFCFF